MAETGLEKAAAQAAVDLAGLRARGAERLDPVHFHYLETLAGRLATQPDPVRRVLEARLAEQVASYAARFEQAPPAAPTAPPAAAPPSALAELTRAIAEQFPAHGEGSLDARFGSPVELKTMRYFRDTWTRLSVEKQVTQAIEQAPENAGPLNSQRLVLRALGLMREISPAYLGRFMAYADALVWLDPSEQESKPVLKSAAEHENNTKKKTSRARPRQTSRAATARKATDGEPAAD